MSCSSCLLPVSLSGRDFSSRPISDNNKTQLGAWDRQKFHNTHCDINRRYYSNKMLFSIGLLKLRQHKAIVSNPISALYTVVGGARGRQLRAVRQVARAKQCRHARVPAGHLPRGAWRALPQLQVALLTLKGRLHALQVRPVQFPGQSAAPRSVYETPGKNIHILQSCIGCERPFRNGVKCGKEPGCSKKGLHAHHPRNCLLYLRHKEIGDLQGLLDVSIVVKVARKV